MKTGSAIRLNALASIAPPLAGILSAPILAQGLGVDDRGAVAGVTVNLALAATALTLGLPEAINFYTGRDGKVGGPWLWRSLCGLVGMGALAGFILVLTADTMGYSVRAYVGVVLVALSIPVVMVLSLCRAIAAGAFLWRRIALERLITSTARLVVLAGLWLTNLLTITSAVAAISATTLVGAGFYLRPVRDAWRNRGPVGDQTVVRFAAHTWPGVLAGALLVRVDQFLMVPLSTNEQLGLYVTAVTITEACSFGTSAVRDVIFSAEARRQDVDRVAVACRLAVGVTAALSLVAGLASIWVVPILFGSDFAPSVELLPPLLAAGVLGASSSVSAAALSGWGHAGWRSVGLVSSLLAKVALVVLLVPVWGAVGAVWATVVGTAVAWTVVVTVMAQQYHVNPVALLVPRVADLVHLKGLTRR